MKVRVHEGSGKRASVSVREMNKAVRLSARGLLTRERNPVLPTTRGEAEQCGLCHIPLCSQGTTCPLALPPPHGSSLLAIFLLLLLNELVYFWLCWSLLQYTGLVGATLVTVCGLHIATAFLVEKGVRASLLQSLRSVVEAHGLFSCPN